VCVKALTITVAIIPCVPGAAVGIAAKSNTNLSNSNTRVTTFPEEGPSEIEFKKNKDISIENHAIINTQDFQENGYPVEDGRGQGRKGSALGRFTNGHDFEIESETSQTHPTENLKDVHKQEVVSKAYEEAWTKRPILMDHNHL
jgi:hypothetical protein